MRRRWRDHVYGWATAGGVWLREAARRSRPATGGPVVSYGMDRVPGRSDAAFGGIVKCQDLETRFPHTPARANILYLVSSALPLQAPILARFARKRGMCVVLNQDGVAYKAWHGEGWEEANLPARALVQGADYVFYQSEFSKISADRFLHRRQVAWEILSNAVDTRVFVPASSDPDPGRLVVLVSGSHWSFYRISSALQALALLGKRGIAARLIIAGRLCWEKDPSVAQRDAVDLCRKLGVEALVRFAGVYSQSDAPALFQSAHVLLHTKYNDPCPRLVLEAMACGLPVVYSASGGVPELVGSEAGIGVPAPLDWEQDHPPDPEELAEALSRVAGSRMLFAQRARERAVAKFDVVPWLDRHEHVFKTLLETHGRD